KQVHQYAALGIGYRDEHKAPVGVLVLHYAHAKDAAADLPIRRSIAQDGVSLVTARPYRDALFTLQGAAVIGSDLVLRLRPAGGLPRRLFDMVQQRDMSFALCP